MRPEEGWNHDKGTREPPESSFTVEDQPSNAIERTNSQYPGDRVSVNTHWQAPVDHSVKPMVVCTRVRRLDFVLQKGFALRLFRPDCGQWSIIEHPAPFTIMRRLPFKSDWSVGFLDVESIAS